MHASTSLGCDYTRFEMNVTVGNETASIPNGQSATLGGLLVTNTEFFEFYDNRGDCNFGHAEQSLYGAAAAP